MTSDMVVRFFENYGWMMTILATSGIVFIGFLKSVGAFNKLKDSVKKHVYFASSCIVSIFVCTVYLLATHAFDWASWAVTIVCIIGYTMAIYGLYENTGIRTLCKKYIYEPFKKFAKNSISLIVSNSLDKEKIISLAVGLGGDVLSTIAEEVQKQEREKELAAKAETVETETKEQPEINSNDLFKG